MTRLRKACRRSDLNARPPVPRTSSPRMPRREQCRPSQGAWACITPRPGLLRFEVPLPGRADSLGLRQSTEPFSFCAALRVPRDQQDSWATLPVARHPLLSGRWCLAVLDSSGVCAPRCLMRLAVHRRRHPVLRGDSASPACWARHSGSPAISLRTLNGFCRSNGSSHFVVGEKRKTFSNKSLEAAVCTFRTTYDASLAVSP